MVIGRVWRLALGSLENFFGRRASPLFVFTFSSSLFSLLPLSFARRSSLFCCGASVVRDFMRTRFTNQGSGTFVLRALQWHC
jgi:hypothetical protein